MIKILIDLLMISLITVMVEKSGWWDSLDSMISGKFRFHHLPKIFMCCFCQTFWLSILYMVITGHFTLPMIVLCLVNANLTDPLRTLISLIKRLIEKPIEALLNILK